MDRAYVWAAPIVGTTDALATMKFGHPKDRRLDLKQVQAGLAVTGDGAIPVWHRAYDGNAGEVAQVVGAMSALKDVAGQGVSYSRRTPGWSPTAICRRRSQPGLSSSPRRPSSTSALPSRPGSTPTWSASWTTPRNVTRARPPIGLVHHVYFVRRRVLNQFQQQRVHATRYDKLAVVTDPPLSCTP